MDNSTQHKRIKEMAHSLREKGLSLKAIGKKLNLSKQRIHQILEEQFLGPLEFEFYENLKKGFKIKEIFKRGWPDFLIVAEDGKICAVEVKSHGDSLNKFQIKVCLYLEAMGLPVFISEDGKLNQEIIDYFKTGKGKNIFKLIKVIEKLRLQQKRKSSKEKAKQNSKEKARQHSKEHFLMKLQWEALQYLKRKYPEQTIISLAQGLKIPLKRAYRLSLKNVNVYEPRKIKI